MHCVTSQFQVIVILLLLQAFASQYVYCQKKLGLDPEKINVNGGAMAIGHPLGATGTCSQISCSYTFWCNLLLL